MVFFAITPFWVVFLMLITCRPHAAFRQFLRERLPALALFDPARLLFLSPALAKVWLLDLDPAIPFLLSRYSSWGRPCEFDPVDLLRSLFLMTHLKVFSISKWVHLLRHDKVLATLCGFEPGKTPSVGLFYAFQDRFWLENPAMIRLRRKALRPAKGKPKGKVRTGQKLAPKHPGVVKRLVDRALKGRSFPRRPERLIQAIFARCCVDQSVALGLIPHPGALVLAGDGSPLRTGTSPAGVKVCHCREQGIYRCSCPRHYPDPDATWGWDSYREVYYYGYSLYELTAADSPYELPVFISLAQACRHDAVLGVVALAQFKELFPHLGVAKAVWDAAHDAYDFYRLHYAWQIQPFIDLNDRAAGRRQHPAPVEVNEYGVPRCPAGHLMVYYGFDQDRFRLKWRCPMVAASRRAKKELSCPAPCSPSPYGRTVYTKPRDDPRLFTPTPRNSRAWKKTYALRSAAERSFKRAKVDYELERCRVRSKRAWFWRSHLVGMNQHLDAWVDDAQQNGFDVWAEALGHPLAA